ncbi:MAG: tRNA pseudouridine(38-40) synthase TruA [Gemmatimonadetes bacterium]|nr:tRNA pseudouridine(38-40) synthase TruA [Gemmatimonadota bacterium]
MKLTLHYDGAGFAGWQVQPHARTVQSELEAALSRLADRPTTVLGAGRTDRGVHAIGQVASALVPGKWEPERLRRALNAILPEDIWVAAAEEVALSFHARYHALARAYAYQVGTSESARSPFRRRWCWPLAEPLETGALNQAAAALEGEHSFRAFARAGQPERGCRCTVYAGRWTEAEGRAVFHITANRFLHHMVRYLVGTMVDAARARRPPEDIARLLAGERGLETSPPAPPEGLFLIRVYYARPELGAEEQAHEDLP